MARAKVDESEIAARMKELPSWQHVGNRIERPFEATSFRAAQRLLARIADLAEGSDHHPDVRWSYRTLSISLTTHDAGGLTGRDFHLARLIEDVLADG